MFDTLWCDTETYSEIPIKHGHHKYAEGVEVMLFAYAWNDEKPIVIDLANGEHLPHDVVLGLTDPQVEKVFHNSQFDRTVIREGMGIDIPVNQIHDTMVQALTHGLPGGLSALCAALKVPLEDSKDAAGRNLINLFCKPTPKNWKIRRATKETHPAEWQHFIDYAGGDIKAMRAISKKIPIWNYVGFERALWVLDQKINDRGFLVDMELAEKAVEAIKLRQKDVHKETHDATLGCVERATQRDKMLDYIGHVYGFNLPDLRKSTVEQRLNDPSLPWAAKELLMGRLEASTTSTSKYKALMASTNTDSRLRGALQYSGAARTRRWAGRVFQPQNLPRPTHKDDDINKAIDALKANALGVLDPKQVIPLLSSAVRGSIIAPEGKKLVVSDLSNIEGRKAAWLADETWKLQAFSDFDNGKGHDLYIRAFAKAFGIAPEDVSKDDRQVGKVLELSMQYQGGVGAFLTFAAAYRLDLDELAEQAMPRMPGEVVNSARNFLTWSKQQRRSLYGLSEDTFVAMDALKRLWRDAHPGISGLWKDLEYAARGAIANRGKSFRAGKLMFERRGNWLRCRLPSGAYLCYPSPRVDKDDGSISYMGVNQYTRRWERLKTYGGKLLENACQSSSRDVMAAAMPEVERQGYEILLTVHDELITEAPNDETHHIGHLNEILATPPSWCADLPLAAGGFESYRYKKD